MRYILITPQKDRLLAEISGKASDNLNNIISQIVWLKWKKMKDVNGKACQRWYIVVDTSSDKEKRLSQFAKYMCVVEEYIPSPRICPHDLYYEDYINFFEKYKK